MTVNPAGTYAYVANYNDATVSVYSIDATTGALAPVTGSPFATGGSPMGPFGVTVTSAGTFAYVPNAADLDVSAYSINGTTGAPDASDRQSLCGRTQSAVRGREPRRHVCVRAEQYQ